MNEPAHVSSNVVLKEAIAAEQFERALYSRLPAMPFELDACMVFFSVGSNTFVRAQLAQAFYLQPIAFGSLSA